jgi:hypothetical protein
VEAVIASRHMSIRTAFAVLSLVLVACEGEPAPTQPAKQAEAAEPAKPVEPIEPAKPTEPVATPEGKTETKAPPPFMSEQERLSRKGELMADHERRKVDITGLTRRGSENAKVVVLGCIDMRDPYVKLGQRSMAKVLAALPNDVALYIRPYWNLIETYEAGAKRGDKASKAIRDQTHLAAEALVAAEQQGKIWELHDLMLETDTDLYTRDGFTKLATDAGLDVAQWTAALDSEETKTAVAAHKQACNALGVDRAVPMYFINGRMMRGAQRPEDMQYVVEVELFGGFEVLPK